MDSKDFIVKDGILVSYVGNNKNVNIPNYVNEIGKNAFSHSNCPNSMIIESISIPNSVRIIREGAFCCMGAKFQNIVIPGSVRVIERRAFHESSLNNLKSIELKEGIEYIGSENFDSLSITSIKIPSTVKRIEKRAIYTYANQNITIFCNLKEQPNDWDSEWVTRNSKKLNIIWNK